METSWLGGRVPLPDLEEMIEGALRPVPKPMGPNARFGYPLRGGFQALMNGFLPHVREQLRLGTRVAAVSPSRRRITLGDGTELPYEYLISTMPLPVLVRRMGTEAPREVQRAAAGLRHVSVRCVHLGVGRERLTDKHWIYYPEDTVFHRIFVQGNASPYCNPPGGFGLTCEITYSPHKPLPCDGDALIQRCITDCQRVGIIKPRNPILDGHTMRPAARLRGVRPCSSAQRCAGSGLVGRAGHHSGGPIQRMGVLQFRPCVPGGQTCGRPDPSASDRTLAIPCRLSPTEREPPRRAERERIP